MSKKTIWLDGRNINRTGGTGVYHYALDLFKTLKLIGYSPAWLLESPCPTPVHSAPLRLLQAIAARPPQIRQAFKSTWGDAYLAKDLYRIAHIHYQYHHRLLKLYPLHPPTIMHWTYPLPIIMDGCQNIVTVHDLIPLTHSHLTGIPFSRHKRLITDLIRHNVHFVTVSETVRQQMLKIFPLDSDRVTTLYQSVEFDPQTREAMAQAPQIAPENSFIFYGRIERRKNIETLLEAHALSQTKTPLIIIGPPGDDQPDCRPRGPTSHIIRLPWSERLSLLRTLSEAKALLFPSLAEGFGLPIIEAMSLGVPVLTSQEGVTKEIAGDAAFLCDPNDLSSLTAAIIQLDKLSPQARTNRILAGEKRAIEFNTENYSQRLRKFYDCFYL
ncbi:glycosyltransferase family 1 protein [Acetobacteraceae bacterium ESL0709]|nr:glycosyltransferase family 1 protein [Acetobacteraceae bacterium ESL0697]MDF7679006.1 glycosyltransferase family 1 protein [Acetobacteraceae bacterium ESL0709]